MKTFKEGIEYLDKEGIDCDIVINDKKQNYRIYTNVKSLLNSDLMLSLGNKTNYGYTKNNENNSIIYFFNYKDTNEMRKSMYY